MAISHLSVKVGPAGKAGPHAAYIAREGKYAGRLEKGERLEAKEAGNLPAWAQADPQEFWQAADLHERKNGTTYREFEVALPRELTASDRLALVREFVGRELGDRHAYQFAIHCPTAVDGKEQPHAHIMFSERQRDGIERDPGQYFKRYNAKAPEKGGAKKGWGEHAGQTRTRQERAEDLKALRRRWEQTCNAALERAGQTARVDLRSNAERGLALPPERKMRPSEWRTRRAEVIEFRQARAELSKAVPDAAAEIINLEERRRIEKGRAEARRAYEQYKAERTGPAVQSSRFKAKPTEERQAAPETIKPKTRRQAGAEQAERSRPDFEAMPIETQAKALDMLVNSIAQNYTARIDRIARKATVRRDRRAEAERKLWETEPKPPTGLLASFKRQGYETALGQWRKGQRRAERLQDQAEKTRGNIAKLTYGNAPQALAMRLLERTEPDLTRRVDAHRAAERKKQREEQARAELAREFRGLAARRAMKAHGFTDGSNKWQATPEPLRAIIDDYNRRPKEQQERALAAWMRDPQQSKAIAALIEQRRENSRDQGMSR